MIKELDSWKEALESDSYDSFVTPADEKIGSFLEFDSERTKDQSAEDGRLAGIPFGVKDNIAVKNFNLTCGSKMLEGLLAPYTSTAVQKLQAEGAVVVGKNNLDEFGMGSSNDNSALGETNNPYNAEYVAGGSSGGSAAAVAAGLVPFALGTDTGGSVRQPAAFCGVYGLKPTYGSVSRYGLVAYASSLEVIGVLSRSVEVAEEVFDIMKGQDPLDQTSMKYEALAEKDVKTIGILKGDLGLTPDVQAAYDKSIEDFKALGYEFVEIELPKLEYSVPVYYTIATAEASANLARYNGIRYGYRPDWSENPDELVRTARDEGFGDEVKLRVILGTYVLRSGFQDQYYTRAQKIRTAIRNDFEAAFEKVDVILMPAFPSRAFKHGNSELTSFQQKVADRFTSAANLTGMPAMTFPVNTAELKGVAGHTGDENELPHGMQLFAPAFGENRIFQVLKKYEAAHSCPAPAVYSEEWRK